MSKNILEILKSIFNNIQSILIVVLVIIILLMRQSDGGFGGDNTVIKDTTYVETIKWDTIKVPEITYVPKWRTKVVTKHDTIPTNIDTALILKDYYSKYFYSDTLSIDTIGSIVINDTITQNKILVRAPKVNVLIPTITKEIKITEVINEREFYYGVGLHGNNEQLNYLGGEFMYRTKNKQVYGIGVGINQDLKPIIGGRMYWKIGK